MFGALYGSQQPQQDQQRPKPFGSLRGPGGALSSAMAGPQGVLQNYMSPQAPAGFPMNVSGMADNSFSAMPKLPARTGGAFDNDHRSQTLLDMAAGFFGSQNFGDGLANAARAIYRGNEDAWTAGKPTIGGPDDAFEVYTDQQTGEHTFKPIQAVQDYNANQQTLLAEMRNRRAPPSPKDSLDAIGRLSSSVAQYPAEQQAQAWTEGRDRMGALGFEGIPDTYNPAYREYGAPVPTMARAAAGAAGLAERGRHNQVMEGIAEAKLQGPGRTQPRPRAANRGTPPALSPDGQYEYRTVNGKLQRRRLK